MLEVTAYYVGSFFIKMQNACKHTSRADNFFYVSQYTSVTFQLSLVFAVWKYLGCSTASKLISVTICGKVVNVSSKMDFPPHISFTVHSKVEVWACLMFWWTRYDTLSFDGDNLNICHLYTTWNVWFGLSLRLLWKPLHICTKTFVSLIFKFLLLSFLLPGSL